MYSPKFIFTDDLFFRNFAYLKEKYCLSRKAMGRLLGISVFTVKDIELNQGISKLPLSVILRTGEIFGIDAKDLLSKDLTAQP